LCLVLIKPILKHKTVSFVKTKEPNIFDKEVFKNIILLLKNIKISIMKQQTANSKQQTANSKQQT